MSGVRQRERQVSTDSSASGPTITHPNGARTRRGIQLPGIRTKGIQQQTPDSGRRECITYKIEWRIGDVASLAARVEGRAYGEYGGGSEVTLNGRQTVDGMYKFDLGQ